MASVKKISKAQRDLNLAMGRERVSLSSLTKKEFNSFLREFLDKVDLRKMREFQPLNNHLNFTLDGIWSKGLRRLLTNEFTTYTSVGFSELGLPEVAPQDYTLFLSRGSFCHTYKRYETGEETDDFSEFRDWPEGAGGIISGTFGGLFLRRPRNHSEAIRNIFSVECRYQKVSGKNIHAIESVTSEPFQIENLRNKCGEKEWIDATHLIIRELCTAQSRTVSGLRADLDYAEKTLLEMERYMRSID